MSDIKSLLTLTNEARLRDQPFIDTITTDVSTAIDLAMTTEVEYRIEYDINAALSTADGALQITRVKNFILNDLRTKGYRAAISTTELSPVDEMLVVTWTVATLQSSL